VTLVILARDLMFASRLAGVVGPGVRTQRVEAPADLPEPTSFDLLVVDWAERGGDWGELLTRWRQGVPEERRPRIVLYGPHSDLAAHRAARESGLGPMLARSAVLTRLSSLIGSVVAERQR